MKITKKFLVSLAFLALVGYGAFTTIQLRQLQSRVAALERLQARVGQLRASVHALQQEQKNPRPRLLSQNESR